MTWEWSHTPEAYDAARENLHRLDHETLAVIFAEWKASVPCKYGEHEFRPERYPLALLGARKRPSDCLADAIWDLMSEQRSCTNGGREAHCCPFGCGCHMVSFSNPEETEEE